MQFEPIFSPATILGSQGALAANTAFGIVTASGKLKLLNSANTDGSQNLAAVLYRATDTTGGDVVAEVVIDEAGFKKGSLVYGGSDTDATHFNAIGQSKAGVSLFVF
jgi:hypothetical protein